MQPGPLVSTVVALAAALSVGCGGAAPKPRPVTEFTERDGRLFEDGVDFVGDPEALGGRWRDEWSEHLDHRVRRADAVAIVMVRTVRTDIDLDRRSTYRLLADVEEELLGALPEELSLTVNEQQQGFTTVQGNEERILNQPFVAFVKWYRTRSGQVEAHWHLAPASEPVLDRTAWLLEKRRDVERDRGRRSVVVHDD
jgi:hypothetical protein